MKTKKTNQIPNNAYANIISEDMFVEDRFCPVCGTPYKKITYKYIGKAYDSAAKKERTAFVSQSEFECNVCRYIHDELDIGYCDYAKKD